MHPVFVKAKQLLNSNNYTSINLIYLLVPSKIFFPVDFNMDHRKKEKK